MCCCCLFDHLDCGSIVLFSLHFQNRSSYLSVVVGSLSLRNFARVKSTTAISGDVSPPGPASFSDTEPVLRDEEERPLLVNNVNNVKQPAPLSGGLRRVLAFPDLLS